MSAEQKEDQALDYSNRGYTHMTSHIRRPEPSARSMKKTLSRVRLHELMGIPTGQPS
jgi:hypothetical protein